MNTETLKLFNAIPVQQKINHEIQPHVLRRTLEHGYILDSTIKPTTELLDEIEKVVGISGEKANASFHKSWKVVKESSMTELVLQQMIHYFTTYGFETLGGYSEDTIYIPNEELDISGMGKSIPLTYIRGLYPEEILEKIVELGSGIALAQETLDAIMTIIEANKYESDFVEKIGNRELKALLYDHYGIVPSDPLEFLRHLISKLTNESLLIKNKQLIEKIKESNGKFVDTLMEKAPEDLASIFFRFKPLFLAMKSIAKNKTFFNQLRKKANTLHKPLPEDYLNSVTAQIKYGTINFDTLESRLSGASIFRKIRLAYALNNRLDPKASIVYRVRNGRGWATSFAWSEHLRELTEKALDVTILKIVDDISPNVCDKTIYIPSNIHYALPATEKQFTGNLPTGTYVSVPEDLIVGIHWTNTKNHRVDLDLSVIGESGKIGWDASYRNDDASVMFSGDVTSAPKPKGASELFYIKKGAGEPRIMTVNYYNFDPNEPVDCRIIAAHESTINFGKNYMVNVDNIVAEATIKISQKQNILGLIACVEGENRVYFANVSVGNSITSGDNAQSTHARDYLVGNTMNTISFRDILTLAGANVVDDVTSIEGDYLNLAPEALSKDTLINIIKSQ